MQNELLGKLSRITDEEQRILCGKGGIDRSLYSRGDDFVVDLRRFLQGGAQIALRPHTRFTEFPLHGHNYVEMMYVVSGSVTHIVAGEELILRSGELLFLGTHTRHRVLPAKKEDIAFNLILSPDFFCSFLESMAGSEVFTDFMTECIRKNGGEKYLHFNVSDIPPVGNILENLVYSLYSEEPTPERILKETFALLLHYLLLYPKTLLNREIPDEKSEALRQNILQYIQSEYRTASLSDLADRLGFSPQYVSEWIRKNTEGTFISLVQDKRFSVACRLLLETDLAVGDIISAVGYENSSYFHRMFRKKCGMTPHRFRAAGVQLKL